MINIVTFEDFEKFEKLFKSNFFNKPKKKYISKEECF